MTTTVLPAFAIERGHLLSEGLSDLRDQFALISEHAGIGARFALRAVAGDLAEIEEDLAAVLPEPEADERGAQALVPFLVQVAGQRLAGIAATASGHAQRLEGRERIAVEWLAHRALELAGEAEALTEIPTEVAQGARAGVCKPSARLKDGTAARPATAISGETAA